MDAIMVYGGMAFTVLLVLLMWLWFGRGGGTPHDVPAVPLDLSHRD